MSESGFASYLAGYAPSCRQVFNSGYMPFHTRSLAVLAFATACSLLVVSPTRAEDRLSFATLELNDQTDQRLPRFSEYSAVAFQEFLGHVKGVDLIASSSVAEVLIRQHIVSGRLPGDPDACAELAQAVGGRFLLTGTATAYSAEEHSESLTVELVVIDATAKSYAFRKSYSAGRARGIGNGSRKLLDVILTSAKTDLDHLVRDLQQNQVTGLARLLRALDEAAVRISSKLHPKPKDPAGQR